MKKADGNQSPAAEMLGINRNTLRKKLQLQNAGMPRRRSARRAPSRHLLGCRRHDAGADQRLRQDRHRRFGAGAARPRRHNPVDRRHRAAARRSRGCRSPRSPTTPASRKCSTAASRRCIRRSTAACWRADLPEHMAALQRTASTPIDLLVVNLYPFEQTVAARTARWTTRSRTSTSAARRCCARRPRITTRVTVVVDPADYAGGARRS